MEDRQPLHSPLTCCHLLCIFGLRVAPSRTSLLLDFAVLSVFGYVGCYHCVLVLHMSALNRSVLLRVMAIARIQQAMGPGYNMIRRWVYLVRGSPLTMESGHPLTTSLAKISIP